MKYHAHMDLNESKSSVLINTVFFHSKRKRDNI
jgi:hypothetical protein